MCSKNKDTILNSKKSNNIETICLQDGSLCHNKPEIAEHFNLHYKNYAKQLAAKIKKVPRQQKASRSSHSIFLRPTDESEIESIISTLKSNTSPGVDEISSTTLKEIKMYIKKPMSFLINKIIENSDWPSHFKIGIIKPLYKSGDRKEIINYRPITLISNLAKIAEKAIKSRLTKFFEDHGVISNLQFGFRKGRSTQDAVECLTSKIYSALDASVPSLCIFVDLAKAFDTVDHHILIDKLERCGVRGAAGDLIRSYLNNRVQIVDIGHNVLSTPETVSCGVPQGTVLGPLLFLVYINDLLTNKYEGEILSYADDTAIFYSADSWESLQLMAERDFCLIKQWFDASMLTVNADKTTFLPFTSYTSDIPCKLLTIGENDDMMHIHSADSARYLGITIDKHLRWNFHINQLTKKLRPFIFKFKLLRDYLNISQLKTLYHSFVKSLLSYGIIAWGGTNKCYLKNLEVIHKWILKVIFKKRRTYPSDDLFKESGLLDIRQIYASTALLRQFKLKQETSYLDHYYETRYKNIICKKRKCKKAIGQRNFVYLGQKLYDKIPEELKSVKTYHSYKRSLNKWLLQTSRAAIHEVIEDV